MKRRHPNTTSRTRDLFRTKRYVRAPATTASLLQNQCIVRIYRPGWRNASYRPSRSRDARWRSEHSGDVLSKAPRMPANPSRRQLNVHIRACMRTRPNTTRLPTVRTWWRPRKWRSSSQCQGPPERRQCLGNKALSLLIGPLCIERK
jgi:hypothetical protein